MRLKIECPIDFFECDLSDFTIDNINPEVLICNPSSGYGESELKKYTNLQMLVTPSTGVNHIDLQYCSSNGIQVYSLLDDRSALEDISASAEFTWLHIMNAVRNFHVAIEEVRKENWRNKEDELRGHEMRYKTLGIIGMGRIGRKIVYYATAFGMQCKYYDPYVDGGVELNEIAECDVVAVCPYLTVETVNMINADFLSMCKPGTIIVNTSRGEVVNETDICNAVESGRVRYCADVVCQEWDISRFFNSRLYQLCREGKVCITPHIAGATVESQRKAFKIALNLIRRRYA